MADHFGQTFTAVAIFMLTVVFFVGVLTVRRLLMLNRDEYISVVGMNRLRHAYLELHPELEPHLITSPHDPSRPRVFRAPVMSLLAGGLAFLLSLVGIMWSGKRSFRRYGPAVEPRFPTPKSPTS